MYWGKDFYKNFQIWADGIQNWHPKKFEEAMQKAWDFVQEYMPKVAEGLIKLFEKLSEEELKKIVGVIIEWLKKTGLLKDNK